MTSQATILEASVLGLNAAAIGTIALIVIMVTMGLTLQIRDFHLLLTSRRAVLTGLVSQLVLLPALAFLLVFLLSPPAPVAIGLILLACCPGGATSNFFTHLARGDVALSVTLTTVSGVVVVFSLPLLVNLGLIWFEDGPQPLRLPVGPTMLRIFLLILFPVMVGMTVRRYAPSFAARAEPILTRISFGTILITMGVILDHVWADLGAIIKETWQVTVALNATMLVVGYLGAKLVNVNEARSRCIAIETGVQNYILSVVLALTLLGRPDFVAVPVMYLFTMYVTVFSFIAYCRFVRDAAPETSTRLTGEAS